MKFVLRDYQGGAIHLLRSCILRLRAVLTRSPRVIFCLPTGGGKTVCFSHLAELAQRKGSRVAITAHRKILIQQAQKTMEAYGVNPLMISYGMVQTYVRSPHKIPDADLWIIDECHIGNFRKFVELLPKNVQVIGVTATPLSSNKKEPLREVFDEVVCPVQVSELITKGYLSSPTYHIWKLDESKLEKDTKGEFSESSQMKVFSKGDLIESYNRRVGKSIIFCSSIAQSVDTYDTLREMYPSDDIFCIHSKMKDAERELVTERYLAAPDACMINCGILTAGFDDPWIETVILNRATISLVLYMQMIGRGGRVMTGKSRFHVHDLGNNVERHLAWESDRDWAAMFDLQGRRLKEQAAPMKKCISCEAIIYASMAKCPYCNTIQPVRTKVEMIADEVKVMTSYDQLPKRLDKKWEKMSVIELIERAAFGSPRLGKPYKLGWIVNHLREREDFEDRIKELADLKGYNRGWIERQLDEK